jgi:hypothetical protein
VARNFVAASAQYLSGAAPLTATPLTIAGWFNPNTSAGAICCLGNNSAINEFLLYANAGSLYIYTKDNGGAGNVSVQASSSYSTGVWSHAAAVWASATSRSIYLNGGSKASTGVTSVTPTGVNALFIGGQINGGSLANQFDGLIAEIGIWNVALNDAEVAVLALGISPLLIRPEALVFYAPVSGGSPEPDFVSRKNLTLVGTPAVVAHPRMFAMTAPTTPFLVTLRPVGNTLASFLPVDADLPASAFMTHAVRNGHRVLEALAASAESAYFSGILPRHAYLGGKISCTIHWIAKTATSGTSGWDVSLERDSAANLDLDSDSWVSTLLTPLDPVNGASGVVMSTTVTLNPNADTNNLVAGEPFRLRIRSLAAGTATGNTQLLGVELRELFS